MTTQRAVLLFALFASAIAVSVGIVPATAQAQSSSPKRDPAAADVLFRAAMKALDKGDWDMACAKFNASMDLDPAVSTLINIAKCHDHEGKLATAWADLNRALVLNGETIGAKRKADLEKYTKGLITTLEPRLPKLTITVREKPAGLAVTRDGLDVVAVLGDALPVDPGEHEIEATAPGYKADKRTVKLVEGKAVTVEFSLVAEEADSQPFVVSQPSVGPSNTRRVGTYVAGGVGIAGLVLGGVMGGVTLYKKGVIDDNCGSVMVEPIPCNVTGADAASSAQTTGLVSTIGFAVGSAGVATAAILLLTEPKRARATSQGFYVGVLSAGREGATVGIRGAW